MATTEGVAKSPIAAWMRGRGSAADDDLQRRVEKALRVDDGPRSPVRSLSPAGRRTGEDDASWWANAAANSLHQSLQKPLTSPRDREYVLARESTRIAKQVTARLPKATLASLVSETRSTIKVMEEACFDLLYTAAGEGDDEEEASAAANREMASIVAQKIPRELSKWVAMEVYARLQATADEPSSAEEEEFEDDDDFAVDENEWRAAAHSFFEREPAPAATVQAGAAAAATRGARNAGPDKQPGARSGSPVPPSATRERAEAFRKFKQVLSDSGKGFRVVKHNHSGGRRTRVLKYNVAKNRLSWESSRVLRGERIACARICKVHREERVVYVWHMTGGRTGLVKKMVGFETQREVDAQVLELAFLHLKENGEYPTRS